jgi:hypothetical protein
VVPRMYAPLVQNRSTHIKLSADITNSCTTTTGWTRVLVRPRHTSVQVQVCFGFVETAVRCHKHHAKVVCVCVELYYLGDMIASDIINKYSTA